MSETTLQHMKVFGSPTVTIITTKITDTLQKTVVTINAGKSTSNRTETTNKKVVDLNRTVRKITVEGHVNTAADYRNLKKIRARGGTVRFTYSDEIDTGTDPDIINFGGSSYGLNLSLESMDITINPQDRVDSTSAIVYDVRFTGVVAAADER